MKRFKTGLFSRKNRPSKSPTDQQINGGLGLNGRGIIATSSISSINNDGNSSENSKNPATSAQDSKNSADPKSPATSAQNPENSTNSKDSATTSQDPKNPTSEPTPTNNESSSQIQPNPAKSSQIQPNSDKSVAFHSAEIGTRTVKKEDPFLKQNRERAEKQQKDKELQKKFMLIGGGAFAGLVVIGIVVGVIIAQTSHKDEEEGTSVAQDESTNEIINLSNIATKVDDGEEVDLSFLGDQADQVQSGEDVIRINLEQSQGTDAEDQAKLAQLIYWYEAGDYDYVVENKDDINLNNLSLEQQYTYWDKLSKAAVIEDDLELRDDAMIKSLELSKQIFDARGGIVHE